MDETKTTDAAARPPRGETRATILREAMRLFGEKGYAATSVAEIEAAAGLRPGSGGLYRHFASKRAVLVDGVRGVLDARSSVASLLAMEPSSDAATWRAQLRGVALAGFARLDHDRDLNRIMVRELRDFPDLAQEVRRREVDDTTGSLATWLARGRPTGDDDDTHGLAAVVVAAVSHHWTLTDSLGTAPLGVTREQMIETLVTMLDRTLRPENDAGDNAR